MRCTTPYHTTPGTTSYNALHGTARAKPHHAQVVTTGAASYNADVDGTCLCSARVCPEGTQPVLLENCHQGGLAPGAVQCRPLSKAPRSATHNKTYNIAPPFSKWLASKYLDLRCVLLSDLSTCGAGGRNGPNQTTSRIQIL